jgi:RNA polymerase sigma factor (sigma-70 family)
MDIRISQVAVDFLSSGGASVLFGHNSGIAAGDLGSGISDGTPESDLIREETAAETRHAIAGCLGGLTDDHYDVILCRYYFDLTYSDIGVVFGVTESAARRLHNRALKCLRESFDLIDFVPC